MAKFKKNEWIVNLIPKSAPEKIIEINENTGCYVLQNDWKVSECAFGWVEDDYKLWTINDAHNGDVLYIKEKGCSWLILFKNLYENNILHAHYCWCINTNSKYEDSEAGWGNINDCTEISPVSKEVKELFFKTLEGIYIWDDEKKELHLDEHIYNYKDNEKHTNDEHKFDYDAEVIEERITIHEGYVAIIDNNEIILKPREDYINAYNNGRNFVIDEINKMIKNLNK